MKIVEYLLNNSKINITKFTVLDIGSRRAKVGHWGVFGNKLSYFGFDPDKEECARLNTAVTQKNVPWEEIYFPLALGRNNEKRVFYNTDKPQCSSLIEPNPDSLDGFSVADYLRIKETSKIHTNTLKQWAHTNNIPSADFIKIDVQGAELEILQGGENFIDSVSGLDVEVEFLEVYKKQPLFGDVDAWIRSKGFILFDISKIFGKRLTVSEELDSNGQLVWGDALYFKDVNHIFSKSRDEGYCFEALLKLVAIADLYGVPDYSLYVLKKAAEKYAELLGNKLQSVEKIIVDIQTLLNEGCMAGHKANYSIADRSPIGAFCNFISGLSPKISGRLGIKSDVANPGYFWKEHKT